MAKNSVVRPGLFVVVMIAALLSGSGCTRATPEAVSPYRSEPPITPRSSVVSDSAGPEEVARGFILALSENRPGDANALCGGSDKMFTGGLKYLEGSSGLELGDAREVADLPVTPRGTAPNVQTPERDTAEFRKRYTSFATVDGTLVPRTDNQTPNPPDRFVFKIGLGRMPDGRWDVLAFSIAGESGR